MSRRLHLSANSARECAGCPSGRRCQGRRRARRCCWRASRRPHCYWLARAGLAEIRHTWSSFMVDRIDSERGPACSVACMPGPLLRQFATGCATEMPTEAQSRLIRHAERASAPPPSSRRVVVHVATCQDDLSWLSCSWHPNLRIRIVHKCTREHPGFHRVDNKRGGHQKLVRMPWKDLPRPDQPCIEHVDSSHPTAGRETEAYLSEISSTYEEINDDDMHLFIQGGIDEIRHFAKRIYADDPAEIDLANDLNRTRYSGAIGPQISALARSPRIAFASLSMCVNSARDGEPKCENLLVKEGRRHGQLSYLHCGDGAWCAPILPPHDPTRGRTST